jgi:hypothetical protein
VGGSYRGLFEVLFGYLLGELRHAVGRAIAQAVSRRLPTAAPGFEPTSGHVGFVVDQVALAQVFSEYFHFPC